MREAAMVSTARTPIGRAYKGAFNDTQGQAPAGQAPARAGLPVTVAGDGRGRPVRAVTAPGGANVLVQISGRISTVMLAWT